MVAVSLAAEIRAQTCISSITHEMLNLLHRLLLFIFKPVYCLPIFYKYKSHCFNLDVYESLF